MHTPDDSTCSPPIGQSIQSATDSPLAWWKVFGPGAVIASLTIGAGELIFASRGGALFGYRLLFYFAVVLLLKWVLVYGAARHMVLTGAHPFERCVNLPGPRGWFPMTLVLLAAICFPIWVFFHSGTIGTLLAWLTKTERAGSGAASFIFGILVLLLTLGLVCKGGYQTLERIQLAIVGLMVALVLVSLFILQPDWGDLLKGLLAPQPLVYPDWLTSTRYPDILARPIWVETITYVGVIGGSSYDYLAYVSYLRDKRWGRAGLRSPDPADLGATTPEMARQWLRAPLIDSALSFVAVLVFTTGFLACGAIVLGGQGKVPDGSNLLNLQAEFVTPLFAGLEWVYFLGAFLAMFGTLYGTIEVGPAIVREARRALYGGTEERSDRRMAVLWSGLGALGFLLIATLLLVTGVAKQVPGLVTILIPANLFTGVLGCGLICFVNVWADRRYLPQPLRMGKVLTGMSLLAGLIFVALGVKAYWDVGGAWSFLILAGTCLAGGLLSVRPQQKRLKS